MTDHIPHGLIPGGTSPEFTQETLPDALRAQHTLAPGHWAVLNVLEGSLRFANLETGEEQLISAPDLVTIHPNLPHRVGIEGRLRCRIDFYHEPPADDVDNHGTTIGEIMDSAAEIGKRGVRTVQSGVGSVTQAARRIPRVVRRVTGKDETETEAPPDQVIVEELSDDLMQRYLSVLVWLVHTDDKQIDEGGRGRTHSRRLTLDRIPQPHPAHIAPQPAEPPDHTEPIRPRRGALRVQEARWRIARSPEEEHLRPSPAGRPAPSLPSPALGVLAPLPERGG